MSEPTHVLEYEAGMYGGPVNVTLDGLPLKAVQRIDTETDINEFTKVTIVLGGVLVIAKERAE